jgi:hypothetical protein
MKYKTAFRLALRAVGVLVVAQSLPGLVVMLVTLALSVNDIGYISTENRWFLTACAQPILSVAVGLYLFFRAEWIVNLAIPSNRPYCPECGYELTGNVSGVCPECGTASAPAEPGSGPAAS